MLRFTAIPDQNTTVLQEKFKPFAEHLTERAGVKFEYVPARDDQASVEMFINGDVGLAWLAGSPACRREARRRARAPSLKGTPMRTTALAPL